MYCKNCGNKLNENDKFCSNCGMTIGNNFNNSNIPNTNNNFNMYNPQQQMNHVTVPSNSGKTKFIILGIIAVIIAIIVGVIVLSNNKTDDDSNGNNSSYNDSNYEETDNDNNYNDDNYEETSNVKGSYSRDAFSGHSFEYKTGYDSATFVFNKDSTFEAKYDGGNTYRGTYELYNGLYISIKADEIKNDTSINNSQQLSIDINNVANKMMSNTSDMLNTYLIWIKTDSNVLQPFMISYNPDTNSGTAVNILGQEQGTFSLK